MKLHLSINISSQVTSTKKCIHKCTMHVRNVYDRVMVEALGSVGLPTSPFFSFSKCFFLSPSVCAFSVDLPEENLVYWKWIVTGKLRKTFVVLFPDYPVISISLINLSLTCNVYWSMSHCLQQFYGVSYSTFLDRWRYVLYTLKHTGFLFT